MCLNLILGIKIKYSSKKLCKKCIVVLKEIIKNEKNSTLKFDFDYEKRSPYYNEFADDDDIFSLFDFKPNDDTQSIYDIFRNFLFNEDIVMRYRETMD